MDDNKMDVRKLRASARISKKYLEKHPEIVDIKHDESWMIAFPWNNLYYVDCDLRNNPPMKAMPNGEMQIDYENINWMRVTFCLLYRKNNQEDCLIFLNKYALCLNLHRFVVLDVVEGAPFPDIFRPKTELLCNTDPIMASEEKIVLYGGQKEMVAFQSYYTHLDLNCGCLNHENYKRYLFIGECPMIYGVELIMANETEERRKRIRKVRKTYPPGMTYPNRETADKTFAENNEDLDKLP